MDFGVCLIFWVEPKIATILGLYKKVFNFNLTKNSNSIGFTKKLEMSKNTVIPGVFLIFVDRSLN